MLKIAAAAPTRVDLAGGTLDLWPIHQILSHKATVNLGVSLEAHVEIIESNDNLYRIISQDQQRSISGNYLEVCSSAELPLISLILQSIWGKDMPPLTISTSAKSPAGAGLGGSSCLGVTIAAALLRARNEVRKGLDVDEHSLVALVRDIEAKIIHCPTGVQDYWGAVRGGINILTYPPGAIGVETLPITRVPGVTDELILCFSGRSRSSAINNWEIFKRVFERDNDLIDILNEIGKTAEYCAESIRQGDSSRCLYYSEQEWGLRLKLWPEIETPETKCLDRAARQAGARFSRVCGAGGGGVMAIFAPVNAHKDVRSALAANGGIVLNAGAVSSGLSIKSSSET